MEWEQVSQEAMRTDDEGNKKAAARKIKARAIYKAFICYNVYSVSNLRKYCNLFPDYDADWEREITKQHGRREGEALQNEKENKHNKHCVVYAQYAAKATPIEEKCVLYTSHIP